MDTVRIEIPKDPQLMREAANALFRLANAIDPDVAFPAPVADRALVADAPTIDKPILESGITAAMPVVPAPPAPPEAVAAVAAVVTAPPVAAAPEAPEAPAAPGTPALDNDSAGLPHDIRIHSSGKTKYAKNGPNGAAGTWQKKRGVTDEVIAQVEAELRALVAPEAPAVDGAPPFAPEAPAVDDNPFSPTTPEAPATPPAAGSVTFTDLTDLVIKLQTAGKLPGDALKDIASKHGCAEYKDLAARADLWPAVHLYMSQLLAL